MTRIARFSTMVLAGVLLSAGSLAGHAQMHGGHVGHGAAASTATPATKAFEAANAKMHADMAIKYSGDPDVDFVKSMIPHHQGAIEMAKVQLQFGKDPENRKLAEAIIAAQQREIAEMKAWLKARGQ